MRIKERFETLQDSFTHFVRDISDWFSFLFLYSRKHLTIAVVQFERGKDILVDLLIVKRGRYGKHFLNISFLFLVAGAVIGGPAIADYYPTIAESVGEEEAYAQELTEISPEELSTTTVISEKPRFEIIDYEVVGGDTLGSIAEKFSISIDSIKWANSLKT